MSFIDDIHRYQRRRDERFRNIFVACTELIQESITNGSRVTGAPGQPVDTGALRGSWSPRFVGRWAWRTSTKLVYAPVIERGNYKQKSEVGGPHSFELTRVAWERIVAEAERRVS